MTVLFSGRFDRVHPGHIATIQRLGKMFEIVVVIILDYEAQRYPIGDRVQVLKTILLESVGTYIVRTNKENFETISAERAAELMDGDNAADIDLDPTWSASVYASGNEKCVRHMHELGYDVLWTQRSWDYEAHLEK